MNENNPVLETDVYFHNPKFFGDDVEHYYNVECYDGHATGKRCSCDNTAPSEVKLTYPKRSEILKDERKVKAILDYRGLTDLSAEDITFGDIMLLYGKLERV